MNHHRIIGMTMGMPQCWGIFGSGDKIQTTSNTQIGASEDAVQAAGPSSVAAKDDAQAVSAYGSTVATGDGIALVNSNINEGGVQSSNVAGDVTIGYDAGAFQTALQQVGSNLTEAVSAQSNAGKSTLDAVLGQLTSLAESKQTDGESAKNQIVLYVVLAVLALAGVLLWKNK